MTAIIAATARVDPRAELADGVEIGPYCLIGPDITIGPGTRLLSHVSLMGVTNLGRGNTVGQFTVIGGDPQDGSYRGTPTRVEIGDHNVIRERVTIHRATEKEDCVTLIGDRNTLMGGAHVAHDCKLADGISLGEGVMLGGHVHIESHATISGGVAVIHNVTIGECSRLDTKSKACQDVPRFMRSDGNPSEVRGINVAGLKRQGVGKEAIVHLREAFRLIFIARVGLSDATEILEAHGHVGAEVRRLLEFLQAQHNGRHGRSRERGKDVPR